MKVDMLEFHPLDASPVYAPAEADTVRMASVRVSIRVSVIVLVEEKVKYLVVEGTCTDGPT